MNPRAGYSLLEVLIAFAIMAMVLAALLPGQARLLRRAANSETIVLASDYAASRIDAIGTTKPIRPGRHETTYRDWTVIEEVTRLDLPSVSATAYQVAVEVRSTAGETLGRVVGVRTLK